MTNIIKLKFLRYGQPAGRDYTYFTPEPVAVGDLVEIDGKQGISQGVVTAVNVPEEEIAPFRDRAKTIIGKVKKDKPQFTSKQTHCGQYKPYGDFFRVWSIETDCKEKAKVLEYCFGELCKRRVPESGEWHSNIRVGGEKDGNANYYFAGYYTLEKTDAGYKFTVCKPWCD
ncbi:hypothetical protein [Caproiciproducens sp.]